MKLLKIDKINRPQIIAIVAVAILLVIVVAVFVFQKTKQTSPTKPYKVISTSKTSPDKKYTVSEGTVGDNQFILIQDSSGNLVTNDLIAQNSNTIGYGTKFDCPCTTRFKGWVDNSNFVIEITTSSGEKNQYLVDSSTGEVDESSVEQSGGNNSSEGTNGTSDEEDSSDGNSSDGSDNGDSSGDGDSSGGGSSGSSGGGAVSNPSNPTTKPRIIP